MRSVHFVRPCTVAVILLPIACAGDPAAAPLAIRHVTVVDGTEPRPRADQSVIIRGNRIVTVGPAAAVRTPWRARVIDGRDRYLIPGLWDMHVHTAMPGGDEVLPLYIANGVTGVRDMAGDWAQLTTWRAEIAAGTRIGPRMILSGPYLEGGDVPIPHLLVREPADAQIAVDSLMRLGVDFVKVHSQLSRENYFAIARAARARDIPFAGHVPRSVRPEEASDSGQRSIEHLLTIPNLCEESEVEALAPRFAVQGALGRCTTDDPAPLFARLVRNDTWVVPTLVAQLEVARWPMRDLPGDSVGHLLPQALRDYVAGIFPMPDDVPAGADVNGLALFDKRVAVVGALHRAGVHVMAGTDAPLRNSPPGFGLHDELGWFVRAGLAPFDALRAATIEPARFLGMQDSVGMIAAGQLADLVLLAADPLSDVRNLRRIVVVIANGRPFEIERTAERVNLVPILR